MFWSDYKWAVVNYLRDNPRSRRGEIIDGVYARLYGNGRHYLHRIMWPDTRDCLTRCSPQILYRDSSNRYVVSESAVLYWQQQDWEQAHKQALSKVRHELGIIANCLTLDDPQWIKQLREKRAILRWVNSHTPEEWWHKHKDWENQVLPVEEDSARDISRIELLVVDG